ncbi:MAG: hypothetical protein P1V97_38735 [Planctomycetota bacterium]|nr:hypothetical protein [Planctomycetota bacterium]
MQIKLSAAKQDQQRCPYCHGDILPTEETTGCVKCSAWFHEECWGEYGGCTNCPPVLASGAPAPAAPILRGRLVNRRRPERLENSNIVAIGTPLALIQKRQKREAATYARKKAFLPSLILFVIAFLISLPFMPQGSPQGFLYIFISITFISLILCGLL